jgi:hypothetical protein
MHESKSFKIDYIYGIRVPVGICIHTMAYGITCLISS